MNIIIVGIDLHTNLVHLRTTTIQLTEKKCLDDLRLNLAANNNINLYALIIL